MVAIVCTTLICATVLACTVIVSKTYARTYEAPVEPQPMITEEDLEKAEAAQDRVPNFQEVIEFINREFSGVDTEGENE